ncbi:microcin-processing peptidase 1. Unknown type peptidase. MEROPS family U62 [Sphingomonas laterariae]|uniref:PmbA protein n=1 Tax=Edaphosphingomonas laterariae TaxID=861865 RepID=A0A239G2K1_9SPHN|nr:TldD/PmbA family protein [Sphingomonas laterariae]SNS62792.1 microcin-processing peptidase 1. Unknown type peptidase. MEROPS family U62 [Sphingomonas laterariae]
MLTIAQAEDRVATLIAQARKAGADAADALYVCDASTQVTVRLGQLEDVERSEGEDIGLRVFVGRRSASVSSSDLSADALAALVDRAVAMAREAPEDPWAGLAPADRLLAGDVPALESDDGADPSPAALRERALAAEEAARGVAGVTNSEGAGATAGRSVIALATSHGFTRGYATTGYSSSASVIAGEGLGMQRDYAYHSARHFADLEGAAAIGLRAGERAVARLNPGKLPSGAMPVVFDPRAGASLLGHFAGAITGAAVARRTSFLLGKLSEQIFAPGITIRDDPHRVRGLRSKPFDGEGLPTHPRDLIADGVLTTWLLDSASARQLDMAPTGHAVRGIGGAPGAGATNLYLAAGPLSPAELMADVKLGLYVTELIGQGVNPITGDYSRGASGFVIRDGQLAEPVAEITVAGNLVDMFRNITPASDLEFRRGVDVPTLRVEGLTIAGA